ncbi:MAG: hypothetical protein ABIU54_14785 [Candidatus Eisenbacteria bacterium]
MKKATSTFLTIGLALSGLAIVTASASAALRAPQEPVGGTNLQTYLNSQGESAIDVNTDQEDIQTWTTTVSGNSTFTLMMEFAGNAPLNDIGIYNGGDVSPAFYQVFPGAAAAGWFATASFRNSPVRVIVNLFDQNGTLQTSNTYFGADRSNFGVYLQGPGGTFYTQDARNPGARVQALTFAGTGINTGSWWICMEDLAMNSGSDGDYDDAILFVESVNPAPTAVNTTTWGTLKNRFR